MWAINLTNVMVNVGMQIYGTEIIPMLIKLTVKERNKEIDP